MITGSSRGLGYALADQFLGFGDDVIISSRNMSACEHAAAQLGEKHPLRKVFPFACDVRNAGKPLRARSFDCGIGSSRQPNLPKLLPWFHTAESTSCLTWSMMQASAMQPHLCIHTARTAAKAPATATSASRISSWLLHSGVE